LRDKNELSILPTSTLTIKIGNPILFEGTFSIFDESEDVARIEGKIGQDDIAIHFSKANMPRSVFKNLQFIGEKVPLSGYGIVMYYDEHKIILRPVAFGLNFLNVF
jgi:hypothetical protein